MLRCHHVLLLVAFFGLRQVAAIGEGVVSESSDLLLTATVAFLVADGRQYLRRHHRRHWKYVAEQRGDH